MLKLISTTILVGFCLVVVACTSEGPDEETVLQQEQEKIATKAVESIKNPLNQANIAKGKIEQHNKEIMGKPESE